MQVSAAFLFLTKSVLVRIPANDVWVKTCPLESLPLNRHCAIVYRDHVQEKNQQYRQDVERLPHFQWQ